MFDIVELVANEEDCVYDQECIYGQRVEHHAVYCHNDEWGNAPRKCRHTWYWGEKYAEKNKCRDRDCKGFKKNPKHEETE